MAPSVLRVLGRPALAIALAVCSSLPSRVALGLGHAVAPELAALGLLLDAAMLGPVFLVAIELSSWLEARGPRARRLGLLSVALLFAVALLTQNAATEFRLERGVMPCAIDLREGLGHHDFLAAEARHVLAGRFLGTNLVGVAIAAVLLRLRGRVRGSVPAHARRSRRVSLLVAASASLALGMAFRHAEAYARSQRSHDALASPGGAFVRGLVQRGGHDGSPAAIRRLLVDHVAAPADVARGARTLGLPAEVADRLERAPGDCGAHPMRRPLDPALEPSEPELVRAARGLSSALFAGRREPPIVFHVSLESMRADDIHALEPAAPAELTPFLSAVYAESASAAAFAHAHQSGVRTSQALAAVMCGMGALPFNLSMSRDLGAMPLRCMPDVLADARFRAEAFYGHDFVFDDMASFLTLHGMTLHGRSSFPSEAPRGVWGAVSDAAVYGAALDRAEADPTGAHYNFILTLSHHAPYAAPSDFLPAHRTEVDALCRARDLVGENCDRLRTLRYADEALRGFLARLESSPVAARSIVVVSGDHAVHQWVPWRDAAEGLSQIPLFVWLPEAMRRAAPDPRAFAEAWTSLREVARRQPVSTSDVPALALALVDASAPLRELPAEARWHTLGGQATSPHYASPTGGGVLHGIDAHGNLFDVSASGRVRPSGIDMERLEGADDVARAGAHNVPGIALLGSFLRNHVARCPR